MFVTRLEKPVKIGYAGHNRFQFIVCLIALTLTTSACQSTKVAPEKLPVAAQQWIVGWQKPLVSASPDAEYWKYTAKIGIKTQALRESANVVWTYSDQSNSVQLFGPLGAGAIRLEFDQYGVQLSDSKGLMHSGDSAERLLTQLVGWPIPVDSLAYWIVAQADPQAAYRYILDEQGRLSNLEQFGWKIMFSDYRTYGDYVRPRRVSAIKKFADQRGLVSVKLIAKTWSYDPDE